MPRQNQQLLRDRPPDVPRPLSSSALLPILAPTDEPSLLAFDRRVPENSMKCLKLPMKACKGSQQGVQDCAYTTRDRPIFTRLKILWH